MNWLKRLVSRPRLYRELAEEIQAHLDEKVEELVVNNTSDPMLIHLPPSPQDVLCLTRGASPVPRYGPMELGTIGPFRHYDFARGAHSPRAAFSCGYWVFASI
jgi:hypothetical protein